MRRFTIRLLAVLLFSMMLFMFALRVMAHEQSTPTGTTILVSTTDDELNNDEDCSLREAIQAANTDSPVDNCPAGDGADTVILQPGSTYHIDLTGDDNLNQIGDFDVTDDLVVASINTLHVQISGRSAERIFEIHAGAVVTMTQIDLSNGKATSGGAIRVSNGHLTLRNGFFRNNTATGSGGVIYVDTQGSLLEQFNLFEQNTATNSGGAIVALGEFTADRSDYRNNNAGAFGGAIYYASAESALINDVDFANNTAGSGGATYIINSPDVTVRDSSFHDNQATLSGGGLYVQNSNVTVKADFSDARQVEDYASRFVGNSADNSNRDGGGAIFGITSTVSIEQTAFFSNTVESGTSIDHGTAIWAGNSTVTLTNGLIANHADSAVFIVDDTSFTSHHVTYANNVEPLATNFSQSSGNSIDFDNNIIWGNGFTGFTAFATVTQNCNTVQTMSAPWDDPSNDTNDPLFVAPNSLDFHLADGSPAIDACASGATSDLDGNARPKGLRFDRGAFESDSDVPTAVAPKQAGNKRHNKCHDLACEHIPH